MFKLGDYSRMGFFRSLPPPTVGQPEPQAPPPPPPPPPPLLSPPHAIAMDPRRRKPMPPPLAIATPPDSVPSPEAKGPGPAPQGREFVAWGHCAVSELAEATWRLLGDLCRPPAAGSIHEAGRSAAPAGDEALPLAFGPGGGRICDGAPLPRAIRSTGGPGAGAGAAFSDGMRRFKAGGPFQPFYIHCFRCPEEFMFSLPSQEMFYKNGWPAPYRCYNCKEKKKQAAGRTYREKEAERSRSRWRPGKREGEREREEEERDWGRDAGKSRGWHRGSSHLDQRKSRSRSRTRSRSRERSRERDRSRSTRRRERSRERERTRSPAGRRWRDDSPAGWERAPRGGGGSMQGSEGSDGDRASSEAVHMIGPVSASAQASQPVAGYGTATISGPTPWRGSLSLDGGCHCRLFCSAAPQGIAL